MCLSVIAHKEASRHRAATTKDNFLRRHYVWRTLSSNIHSVDCSFIQCIWTAEEGKGLPAIRPAVRDTATSDILQFVYIKIDTAISVEGQFIMLQNDHLNNSCFLDCPDTFAEHALRAIVDCCTAFNVPARAMSDGPAHFKNETVRPIAKGLSMPHHFKLLYSPGSSSKLEHLSKELLSFFGR